MPSTTDGETHYRQFRVNEHDSHVTSCATNGVHLRVNLSEDSSNWLRVGDTLSVEVEVDPSFSPDDYHVDWVYKNQVPEHTGPLGNRITVDILECHVGFEFAIYCMVTSNQSWHRCGDVDDCVSLIYKVLPWRLMVGISTVR